MPGNSAATCASLRRRKFSSTRRLAMGKLRSMDSKALREMTITRTVLSDLHVEKDASQQ
jgi:hypothetical protein